MKKNPPNRSAVAPKLSRRHKYEEYGRGWSFASSNGGRKRMRSQFCCSFRIQELDDRGLAMIATRPIACGEVLIRGEAPQVSSTLMSSEEDDDDEEGVRSTSFCENCAEPLGDLRKHILPMESLDNDQTTTLFLPLLGQGPGVAFCRHPVKCGHCNRSVWCSDECQNEGQQRHEWLHCGKLRKGDALGSFLDAAGRHRTILELAVQSAIQSLAVANARQHGEITANLRWWEEYHSHPMWWELGDPEERTSKQELTSRFCKFLRDMLKQKIQEGFCSEEEVKSVCSIKAVGSLLGMLQCNVMEFSYPSPLEQYVEHLGYLEEEGHDLFVTNTRQNTGTGSNCESTATVATARGKQWMEHNASKVQNYARPVIGSGLYPLLTLANHSCDPNASIDFLQESNRGSMVALRDIVEGEEICITYVPNGDLDAGGTPARFDAMGPTRTWKWLNGSNVGEEHTAEEKDQAQETGDSDELSDSDGARSIDGSSDVEHSDAGAEGSTLQERILSLRSYGFTCKCLRCVSEAASSESYCRLPHGNNKEV